MDNKEWMNEQLGNDQEEVTSISERNEQSTVQDMQNRQQYQEQSIPQIPGQNGYSNPYQRQPGVYGQNINHNMEMNREQNTPNGNTYGAYTQSVQKNLNENQNPKKGTNGMYIAKKAAGIALAGVLFGAVAGGAFIGVTQLQSNLDVNSAQTSTKPIALPQETEEPEVETSQANVTQSDSNTKVQAITTSSNGMSVQEIASNGLKSIVAITNVGVTEVRTMWGNFSQESTSSGSGIIIGQTDKELLIVTNYHVVEGSNELTVVFSYDEKSEEPNAVKAKIKGYDSERDLAVIAIPSENLTNEILNEISIATVGDSGTLQLGDQVVAIGNALGYGQSVTVGYVSALDRIVELENEDGSVSANSFIQTDAAINPGNSGGALFNMQGELIGINSAKVSSSSVEGMGYAIPISEVSEIIGELMNSVTRDLVSEDMRGYLGVAGRTVDSATSQAYGIPVGAYINEVSANSAAEKAGIQTGDIITRFDNKSVGTFENLQNIIRYYEAGESVEVIVMRQAAGGYQEVELTVTLCSAEEAGVTKQESSNSNGTSQMPNQGSQGQDGGDSYDDFYSNPFRFFFGN